MPPRFRWADVDMYLPLKVTRDPHIYFGASIKLRPDVTTAQANAELQPYLEQFAKESPERYPEKFRVNLRSITELYAKPLGPTLYLLLGAVASLLLIGCGNVSILLLARGTERQQELAVRAAVGADRFRMIRQLLTESLAIALAGTSLGVLLAWKSLSLIVTWLPQNSFPAESVIKMNLPVLLFSAGLAFATAILFGLSPALQLSRPDIGRLMQSSGRRVMGSSHAKRAHRVMVAAQVALTLLLLSAASAAGKGFLRLLKADLGYDPHAAMSVPIPIHENTHVSWKDRSEYFEQIRASIATMPEVVSAGISTNATPPDKRLGHALRNLRQRRRPKNQKLASITSAPNISTSCTSLSRRAAFGTIRKPCAPRRSPSSTKPWPANIGPTATPSATKSAFPP